MLVETRDQTSRNMEQGSSQLAVANQYLPTRLPSQGQPSSQDITLMNGHLLSDATWSTHTTLWSNHLPITISLSSHAQSSLRKALSFTNLRKADWEIFTADTERKFADTPLPTTCSADENVFRRILGDAGRHHTPCGYVRDYCSPFPKSCDPSSRKKTSAVLTTLSTLPSSCRTGTSSGTSARKRKTSGDPCWNPTTALTIPSATGPFCASWPARGRVPHQISQSPLMEKPNPARRRLHEPSTGSLLPLPNKTRPSEG